MVSGVSNFSGNRLTQARKARGFLAVNLAEMVGVSAPTISLYEKGSQKPRYETIIKLSQLLNLPVSYFTSESQVEKSNTLFYRSMNSATKSMRERVEARHEWALDILEYLREFFDFPALNLPSVSLPENFLQLDNDTIEETALLLREHWMLSDGPIADMTQVLETNGIILYRGPMGTDKLDAFSDYRTPNPIVALSNDKQNYFRSRFDAAHELGHIMLHQQVDKKTLNKPAEFKELEDQANYFASVFLLPSISYSRDLWSATLDAFRSLKPIWGVSIAMQIIRARNLGFVSPDEEKRLWINRTRRGWTKSEPLDSSTPVELPNLIQRCFRVLLDEGIKSKEQIVTDLRMPAQEIESLFGIEAGVLSNAERFDSPKLKLVKSDNLVTFSK